MLLGFIPHPSKDRKMKRNSAITLWILALPFAGAAVAQGAPADQPKAAAATGASVTAADVKAGAALRGSEGTALGTLVSSTDQQAVVDTGQTKIGVPLTLFKKDDKGLLLSITAKQFNDAVAKAHARAQAAQQQQPGQQSH